MGQVKSIEEPLRELRSTLPAKSQRDPPTIQRRFYRFFKIAFSHIAKWRSFTRSFTLWGARTNSSLGQKADSSTAPGAKDHLGKKGERIAKRYLERLGYVILTTNWSCSQGELDIIAYDYHELVVCEVRTRRVCCDGIFDPADSVGYEKQERIKKLTALYWNQERKLIKQRRIWSFRFDVIGIQYQSWIQYSIDHRIDAFE